jgi:hypothetical protein
MFIQITWFGTIKVKGIQGHLCRSPTPGFNFFPMDSLTKSKIGLMVKIKGERMVLLSTFQGNDIRISLRYADACLKRSFLKVVLKSSSLLDRIRMAMTLPEKIRLKNSNCCTAKIQYRKFKTNIPRKGNAQPQSQFPHSCVCEGYIFSHNRSAYSAAGKYVD